MRVDEEEIRAVERELAKDTARYRRAKAVMAESGAAAMTKALDLLRAGVAPSRIERLSPFTDSYIRKAARDAGLPPLRSARGITAPKVEADRQ